MEEKTVWEVLRDHMCKQMRPGTFGYLAKSNSAFLIFQVIAPFLDYHELERARKCILQDKEALLAISNTEFIESARRATGGPGIN